MQPSTKLTTPTDLIRRLADPVWRLTNLYKIIDKQSQLQVFKPNAVQLMLMADESLRRMVLKARQFGITTLCVLVLLDTVMFNRNRTACILAHRRDVLDKIFNMVRVAYKCLPDQLRPTLDKGGGSKYELRFPEINSKIYTALEVRGGTVHDLHISEAAYIDRANINATMQAVPKDGRVTAETTANGLNHYYDDWVGTNDWKKHFFPWYLHAEYSIDGAKPVELTDEEIDLVETVQKKWGRQLTYGQIAFRRWKIQEFQGKLLDFMREYPEDDASCFLTSGGNPLDTMKIKQRKEVVDTHKFTRAGEVLVFKKHDKSKHYVIGADVAEGVGGDSSVAKVWCIEDREDVASFRSDRIKPGAFAETIFAMGKLYSHADRWPEAIVERNNHGHAVLLKLDDLGYPNVWHDSDERAGHRTTNISRPLLLDTFIEAMDSQMFTFNFPDTLGECLTLVNNDGRIEAEVGKHDDCVFADALGIKGVLESEATIKIYANIKQRVLV